MASTPAPGSTEAPPQATDCGESVTGAHRYPVGVLFVHGIGQQEYGQTLVDFGEPLVRWTDHWLDGLSEPLLSRGLRADEVEKWIEQVSPQWQATLPADDALRSRLLAEWLRTKALQGDAASGGTTQLQPAQPILIAGQAELLEASARGPTERIDTPAHATVQVLLLRSDGAAQRTEWLMAESWWAGTFSVPWFSSLARWAVQVVPATVACHFGTRMRRRWHKDRSGHLRTLRQISSTSYSALEFVVGLFFGASVATLIVLISPLALLPIRQLSDLAKSTQRVLASTLGDCYVLCANPVQAAAIISKVRHDLGWLCARCANVVVVAHSQGGAVVFEAIRSLPPPRVRSLITFGSGLRKLEELRMLVDGDGPRRYGGVISLLGLIVALGPVAVASGPPWNLVGLLLGVPMLSVGLWESWQRVDLPRVRLSGEAFKPQHFDWQDYYASFDPVPNGPLFDQEIDAQFVRSSELHNLGALLSDHNSYWENREQFISRIVHAVSALTPLPLDALRREDPATMVTARLRRHWRVGMLRAARWAIWLAGLVVTLFARHAASKVGGETVRVLERLLGGLIADAKGSGSAALHWLRSNELFFGRGALLLLACLLYRAVVLGSWMAWDRREGDLLARRVSFKQAKTRLVVFISATIILTESALLVLAFEIDPLRQMVRARTLWIVFGAVATIVMGVGLSLAWWRYARRREARTLPGKIAGGTLAETPRPR